MGDRFLKKAVFLDRDGTINEEQEYLWQVEAFRFIDGAIEGIRLLNAAGFMVVVVTNQSGIGRGYYTEDDLDRLHRYMDAELEKSGVKITACYYCPHHPLHGVGRYGTECACRKPLPGMLLQAAGELDIDLAASWMVGDKKADIDAGLAAGCRPVLVRTGYGEAEAGLLSEAVPVVKDLLEAARLIISRSASN